MPPMPTLLSDTARSAVKRLLQEKHFSVNNRLVCFCFSSFDSNLLSKSIVNQSLEAIK